MNKETLTELLQSEAAKELLKEEYGIENLTGLVSKNKELLSKVVTAQEELNTYRELGDIKKLKETVQQQTAQEAKKAKETLESSDSVAKEKYLADELNKYKDEYNKLQSSLVNEKTTMTLTEAIMKAKGDVEVLIPLLSQRVKAEYNDGTVNIAVYENGQLAHRNGERMTVSDLVEETKAKHPNLFETSASGSGTKPGSTKVANTTTLDFKDASFNLTKAAEKVSKTGQYESVTKKYGWR